MGFALKMQVGVFQRKRRGKAEEGLGASPVRLGRGAGKARTDGLGACWPLRPLVALAGWLAGLKVLPVEGVTRLAGLGDPGDAGGWRVFLSHTSELREFPRGASYVAAAERAVSAAGHVIVDMADFPAADQAPAQLCADRVRGCDVYVGVLGTRYGSPVRDMPQVSYTELEFEHRDGGGPGPAGVPAGHRRRRRGYPGCRC